MRLLTSRLYIFITLFWVSAFFSATSGNELHELEEVVRSVVFKMLKEGVFNMKSRQDGLDDVPTRLEAVETKVVDILSLDLHVISSRLEDLESRMRTVNGSVSTHSIGLANIEKNMNHGKSERSNLTSLVSSTSASVVTIFDRLNVLTGRVESGAQTTRNIEQGLVDISKNLTEESQRLPSFHPRVAKSQLQTTCGGILVERREGILHFEAGKDAGNNYTCTWTLRAGTYEKIRLKLLYTNFDSTTARLRATPMWLFKKAPLPPSMILNGTVFLSSGNPAGTVFDGPVAFLDLVVANNNSVSVLPSFRILFHREGDRHEFAAILFSHYHYGGEGNSRGVLKLAPYRDFEAVSWVIRPLGKEPRIVTLTRLFMDVENSTMCESDFMQLYLVDTGQRWGNGNKDYINCWWNDFRRDTYSTTAWIAMFFSDGTTTFKGLEYEFKIE